MSVIEVSWASLAWMVCGTDGRSWPLTWRFSVFGSAFFTPAQRVSREVMPCAWTTHSALPPPVSWRSAAPALCPARLSSEPKNISAPYCW